jgi:hypothetical protein
MAFTAVIPGGRMRRAAAPSSLVTVLALALLPAAPAALADSIVLADPPGIITRYEYDTGEPRFRFVPKGGIDLIPEPSLLVRAKGRFQTRFDFHPVETRPAAEITKNFKTGAVSPASVTDVYTLKEDHGTKGSATHKLSIGQIEVKKDGKLVKVPQLKDNVVASITPGRTEKAGAVSVSALFVDPFVFSDTSSDASFPFVSGGLDVRLSLSGGAFPALFAPDAVSPGALAAGTGSSLRVRLVPGVVTDVDAFWSPGAPGAIDLFTLTLTSDAEQNVTALLVLGASDDRFTLDFSDPASAKLAIEEAYVDGKLTEELEDVFVAGFVPRGGVSEFTLGISQDVRLAGNELVPEPWPFWLFGVGLVGVAAARLVASRRPAGRARS